jgi:hypothetical protein
MTYPTGPTDPATPTGWTPGPPVVPPVAPLGPAPPRPRAGLHPLDVNRLVQLTVNLIRFRWRTFYGVTLVMLVPAFVAVSIVGAVWGSALTDWSIAVEAQLSTPFPNLDELPAFPLGSVLLSWAAGIAAGVVVALTSGALVHVASRTYAGADTTARDAILAALRRTGALAGSYLLVMLAAFGVALVGFGLAAVIVVASATAGGIQPGPTVLIALIAFVGTIAMVIFVALRWSLALPSIMIEGSGAAAGLGRSWRIVSGSTWRLLGYMILYGLIAFVFGLLLSIVAIVLVGAGPVGAAPRADVPGVATALVIQTIAAVVFTPISAVVLTLLYYDFRWRRGELS